MLNNPKSWFRAFFSLNKSEQRGILILAFLTLLVFIFNLLLPVFIDHEQTDFSKFKKEIAAFRQTQQLISDSIRIEKLQNRGELDLALAKQKLKPFSFDPNKMPAELWKKIGLTEKQIKSIKNYEEKGGRFYKKEDLKKMYAISEVEYEVLEPYIKITSPFKIRSDDYLVEGKRQIEANKRKQPKYRITEINSADSSDLISKLHYPSWLAERVLKYRNLLGGFYNANQLLDVYGYDSNRYITTSNYIVVDQTLISQININAGSFKEILRHPYVSYELTKEIVNKRLEKGAFINTEELLDEEILSESLYLKLKPYLTVE